jgi:hypothetical protein
VFKNSKNKTIPQTLYDTAQEEEQHQWTDEDIEATIKELPGPMHTRALRDRLNQTLDRLATGPKSAQSTATATIPPGTQIPQTATGPESAQLTATATIPPGTQILPRTQIPMIPQTPAATAMVPPGTQILTPMTPQTPTTFTPQQVATAATERNNPQQPAQQQYNVQQPAQQQYNAQQPATQQQYYP